MSFDDVVYSEHVPASKGTIHVVSVPVTANIATTATKEWIVSTDDAGTLDVLKADEKGLYGNLHSTDVSITTEANKNGWQNNLHETDVSIVSKNEHVSRRSHCDPLGSGVVPDVKSGDQHPGRTYGCNSYYD